MSTINYVGCKCASRHVFSTKSKYCINLFIEYFRYIHVYINICMHTIVKIPLLLKWRSYRQAALCLVLLGLRCGKNCHLFNGRKVGNRSWRLFFYSAIELFLKIEIFLAMVHDCMVQMFRWHRWMRECHLYETIFLYEKLATGCWDDFDFYIRFIMPWGTVSEYWGTIL